MSCGYQGYDFGARYPDSVCIEGMLWDADSGYGTDAGWVYTSGGELPCPNCNFKDAVARKADEAWFSRENGRRDRSGRAHKWYWNQARRQVRRCLAFIAGRIGLPAEAPNAL